MKTTPVPLRREAESGDELFASTRRTIVPEAGGSAAASACGPQRAVGIVRDLLASTVRLLAQTRIWIGGGAGFDPGLFRPPHREPRLRARGSGERAVS